MSLQVSREEFELDTAESANPSAPPVEDASAAAPPPPPLPPRAPRPNDLALPAPAAARAPGNAPETPALRSEREPLLIYTASLTLSVFRVTAALDAVDALAREAGGYLLERNDSSITVRVPAVRFRAALESAGKLGDELHRQVNARDVTDEYADLEIRLRNAEIMRQRLEALLAKTGNIADALAVERELERVAQTIEQLKGRLKSLSELVAFSTLTVTAQPRATTSLKPNVTLPFEWLHQLGLNHLQSL